jgi:hypothetical protein
MSIDYRLTGAFYLYICMLMIEWVHRNQSEHFDALPIGMSLKLQHLTEGIEIKTSLKKFGPQEGGLECFCSKSWAV